MTRIKQIKTDYYIKIRFNQPYPCHPRTLFFVLPSLKQ